MPPIGGLHRGAARRLKQTPLSPVRAQRPTTKRKLPWKPAKMDGVFTRPSTHTERATSAQPSIFVQIPSYRDPQLAPTLLDMIANASRPSSLRIVVCWQRGTEENLQQFTQGGFELTRTDVVNGSVIHSLQRNGARIELLDIPFNLSKGCGWARNLSQQHYDGEHYNLQIDAHHRFSANWDVKMIDLLEILKRTTPKPILTGHPPAFDPTDYPEGRQDYAGAMVFDSFSRIGLVTFKSIRIPRSHQGDVFRAKFVAGGFIFSEGSFVREVPGDPDQFFSTEEVTLAVRAFTHGYEFFHPCRPLLWHQYHNNAPKLWDDDVGGADLSSIKWAEAALTKTLALFGLSAVSPATDTSVYGLGTHRTLLQYERYAGISFRLRGIRPEALSPHEPDLHPGDIEPAEWEKGLLCRRSILIRISSTDSIHLPVNVLVSSHASDGSTLSLRELSTHELDTLCTSGQTEFIDNVEERPDNLPAHYSIHAEARSVLKGNSPVLSIKAVEL